MAPKNTASFSQLGNLYQYLIALKLCLDGSHGDVINIENHGDISTYDHNYEIKHHKNPKYRLTDTHIDFWKSISNWVDNRVHFASYSKFILLTSAIVNTDSPLSDWNSKNKEEKFNILNGVLNKTENSESEYKTISKYLMNVFDFNSSYKKEELLEVLDKISIQHSSENAEPLFNTILNHSALMFAKKSNKKSIIRSLLGFICEKGIYTPESWDLEINEFVCYLQEQAKKSVNDEVLDFPDIESEKNIDQSVLSKSFIEKIERIPYLDKVHDAAANYLYAQNALVIMADQNPHILKNFNAEVQEAGRLIKGMKDNICLDIEASKNINLVKKSKLLYNKADMDIRTGNSPPNFQRGIIHTYMDESSLEWKIKEEDIED